jgi:hypothetical protein
MKKVFLILILGFTPLLAQNFAGIRIYINPGHGGNDPANDRYIPLTGFWESEGNLTKGLYLRSMLENAGAVVFISRTQNRDVDDLPLSQISADANANNVDYFHSIHSNGLNGNASVNYPLMLFRGYDDEPVFPEAKTMGEIMWNQLNAPNGQWTYWPYNWVNNRGDWSFYPDWGDKVGLGVLRGLNMPGTLSEGNFHDYLPNSWRLMNTDYRQHEAVEIFRAFTEFYDLDPMTTGILAGIVRDDTKNVTYSYSYNSGLPNDKKLAVNNTRVTLLPEGITYSGDFKNNGFYLFDSLAPGDYQVVVEAGVYKPDTVYATVTANKTAFANIFLVEDPDRSPEIYTTDPADQAQGVLTHAPITVRFSRPMDPSLTGQAFTLTPPADGALSWEDDDQILTFAPADTFRVSTTYQVVIDTGAASRNGIKLTAPFMFTFTTAADHVRPKIIAYSPAAEIDSVIIDADIMIRFDIGMRPAETQSAFTINPPVNGVFSWDTSNTVMTFNPDEDLSRKTWYTVTISTGASNSRGVSLAEPFTFTFITRQRNEVRLSRSFPQDNSEGISTRLKFILDFDAPINATTVISALALYDESGSLVPLRGHDVLNNRVSCLPRLTLKNNQLYHLFIYKSLKDTLNLPLIDTTEVVFRTISSEYAGTVIEDFEFLGDWQNPASDDSSTGIDPQGTSLSLSPVYKISGSYSARMQYKFAGEKDGVCRLFNAVGFPVNADSGSVFGLWVFGDYSHNMLEIGSTGNAPYEDIAWTDTIDWAGWKLVKFLLPETGLSFNAITVRQISGSDLAGELYIDDAQYGLVSGLGSVRPDVSWPVTFELSQNYPNPFNPITRIAYTLPAASNVRLTVYNLLGQEISRLIDAPVRAGRHEIIWDATGFPSGIYFYRLETGKYIRTRKMVLLR